MKKFFKNHIRATILAVAIFGTAHAQSLKIQKEPVFNSSFKEVATIDEPAVNPSKNTLLLSDVSARALKNFNKSFIESANANWYKAVDGGYVAKFKKDGIETRVNYDAKGHLTGTIRTYREDKLPKEVRHLVKSHYYDYSIFWVDEVTVGDKIAYLVKIEDEKTFKTIRVLDGEMDIFESFIKG